MLGARLLSHIYKLGPVLVSWLTSCMSHPIVSLARQIARHGKLSLSHLKSYYSRFSILAATDCLISDNKINTSTTISAAYLQPGKTQNCSMPGVTPCTKLYDIKGLVHCICLWISFGNSSSYNFRFRFRLIYTHEIWKNESMKIPLQCYSYKMYGLPTRLLVTMQFTIAWFSWFCHLSWNKNPPIFTLAWEWVL